MPNKIFIPIIVILGLITLGLLFNTFFKSGTLREEKEQAILNPPSAESTPEQWKNYLDLVSRVAKETEYLEVADGCKLNPVAIRVRSGTSLTIRNKSSNSQELGFPGTAGTPEIVVIPQGGRKELTFAEPLFGMISCQKDGGRIVGVIRTDR